METINFGNFEGVHPLDVAAQEVGGRRVLAQQLHLKSVAAIGNWKVRGVPFEQCMPIERLTNGKVTRRHLRPIDYQIHWPELAQPIEAAAPAPQEPWDGITERRKLDAPVDRRVSPESVAQAECKRAQQAGAEGQGV